MKTTSSQQASTKQIAFIAFGFLAIIMFLNYISYNA